MYICYKSIFFSYFIKLVNTSYTFIKGVSICFYCASI